MGVGAVIVRDGKVIGRGRNRMHSRCDPLIHAETDAIADACKALGRV
jgi:tRNA(Arg) A34 adenosine deaminase TadA